MADILISRQNYALDGETPSTQENGWKANTVSGALTGTSVSAGGSATIPADFKDHKTVFVITAQAAANVTFKKGDSYQGVNDLVVAAPAGTSMIWLESAPFIEQKTGKITVESDKAIAIFGYEMR